ncbi:MAG TPA: hypothetical protein VFP06_13890 [Acidimicrobiales bacterium]|nr:hypothetical protein [Acidimicrobiales bacterium]
MSDDASIDRSRTVGGATSKPSITPLSWCSAMWQCAIQMPGFVTSSGTSRMMPSASTK